MKNRSTLVLVAVALVIVVVTYTVLNATVRPVQVVVASQDLMAGTEITADMVEVRTMPRGGLPDGYFSDVTEVIGKTLVVTRIAGDPLTAYVVGDSSTSSGIPAMLEPNTVAIALRVDQATGLAGILRPGQYVTVIGIIDPASIPQGQSSYYQAPAPDLGLVPTLSATDMAGAPAATPVPTATPEPPVSPAARVTVSGLCVLVVPQSFRYEEVTVTGDSDGFMPARTSLQAQNSNVILLQASILPEEIAPGVFASPAEILALLNATATIHLALEPTGGISLDMQAEGIELVELYESMTGRTLVP